MFGLFSCEAYFFSGFTSLETIGHAYLVLRSSWCAYLASVNQNNFSQADQCNRFWQNVENRFEMYRNVIIAEIMDIGRKEIRFSVCVGVRVIRRI